MNKAGYRAGALRRVFLIPGILLYLIFQHTNEYCANKATESQGERLIIKQTQLDRAVLFFKAGQVLKEF